MRRRNRKEAAEYLTARSGILITETALAALATKGTGPRFSLVAGRASYADEALDEWLAAALAEESPAAKRGRKPGRPIAA
jgi:hypothetical protein